MHPAAEKGEGAGFKWGVDPEIAVSAGLERTATP